MEVLCMNIKTNNLVSITEANQNFSKVARLVDEYDNWRNNYPKFDNSNNFVKTPSDSVNNAMLDAFKDKLKAD